MKQVTLVDKAVMRADDPADTLLATPRNGAHDHLTSGI